jgi:hypothetical protein
MAILVDAPRWTGPSGVRFAHLASDASHDELHRFAATLPTERPFRFHHDHYDVPAPLWDVVVAAGATVVATRELVTRVRAAGLRRTRATATLAGTARPRRSE